MPCKTPACPWCLRWVSNAGELPDPLQDYSFATCNSGDFVGYTGELPDFLWDYPFAIGKRRLSLHLVPLGRMSHLRHVTRRRPARVLLFVAPLRGKRKPLQNALNLDGFMGMHRFCCKGCLLMINRSSCSVKSKISVRLTSLGTGFQMQTALLGDECHHSDPGGRDVPR